VLEELREAIITCECEIGPCRCAKSISQSLAEIEGMVVNEEEIQGALARGYCSKENEQKVVDPTLIQAMTKEIHAMLKGRIR